MALWDFLSNNAGSIIGGGINYFAGQNANQGNQSAANTYYNRAQYQPYNINTAFGTSLFNGNNAAASLSPTYQAQADQWRNFGNGLFTQMGDGSLDTLRDDQLALLRQLSQPYEDRQRAQLDQNLFNRGQLGSTGGALQSRALTESQGTADLQRQLQSIGLAQNERQSLFDMANTSLARDMEINALPIQQLALGGQLGAQQSSANAQAGAAPYNAAVAGNANELQFWQALGSGIGNFSKGVGAAGELSNLFTAGGGNPLDAVSLAAKETAGGTGSWADLGAGPRQAGATTGTPTMSNPTGAQTFGTPPGTTTGISGGTNIWNPTADLSSSLWGSAGELAAGTNALLGSSTGLLSSGAGSQAAMLAGQNLGLEGATGLTQSALASNVSGGASSALGTAAGLAAPLAMIGGLKFLDSINWGKGGASESAKLPKMNAEIRKQLGIDPSGRSAQAFIDKIITNKQWANEGNGDELGTLFAAGVVSPETFPSLSSSASRYDIWNTDLSSSMESGRGPFGHIYTAAQRSKNDALSLGPAAIATAYGLSSEQARAYAEAQQVLSQPEPDSEGRVGTIQKQRRDSEIAKANATMSQLKPLMTETNKKAYAQKVYQQYRSSGYTGDLSKLEKYLGVK